MLKLMIVDDEMLVRVGIKSCIQWEDHGYVIAGEAENGRDAFEIALKIKPDIILTDIKMPYMDGLEFMEKIYEFLPDTKFIVITGYEEFEYVQKALRLGAVDFFSKLSLEPEDLLQKLNNVKQLLQQTKQRDGQLEDLTSAMDSTTNTSESLLNYMLQHCMEDSRLLQKVMRQYNFQFPFKTYMICVVKSDDYEEHYISRHSLLNIIREALSLTQYGQVLQSDEEQFTIFIDAGDILDNSIEELTNKIIRKLTKLLEMYVSGSVSIGISTQANNFSDLNQKYTEALEAVEYRFLKGRGSIIYYQDVINRQGNEEIIYDTNMEEQLFVAVKNVNEDKIMDIIKQMLNKITQSPTITPIAAKQVLGEVIYTFVRAIKSMDLNIYEIMYNEEVQPQTKVQSFEFIDDTKKWMYRFAGNVLCKIYQLKKQDDLRTEIKSIKNYIDQNYYKDITLDFASKYVNISRTYLSLLFKKEMDQSFNEYITSVRMQKAKEFLQLDDMKIYMVAEQVGYKEVGYFCKVFKRTTGMMPSEYKEMLKNK